MITIEDYMVKDLHLSGNDLIIYALISTKGVYEDSLTTMCLETGVTMNTVRKVLRSLEDNDLITREVSNTNTPAVYKVKFSPTKTPTSNEDSEEKINPKARLFSRRTQ